MVVDDLDVMSVASSPTEADSELVVDADAVLADTITDELLEAVGWRDPEIGESGGSIEHDKLAQGNALKTRRKTTNSLALEQAFGVVVAETANQRHIITRGVTMRKHQPQQVSVSGFAK